MLGAENRSLAGLSSDWRRGGEHLPAPLEGASLFAVFDGHGGAAVSQLLAQLVVEELLAQAARAPLGDALEATFLAMDKKLCAPAERELRGLFGNLRKTLTML